jgi:hypothetical protein
VQIALARGRIDRYAALMLLVHALVFAVVLAGAHWFFSGFLSDPVVFLILLGLVLAWLGWSGLYVLAWFRMRKIDVPLELQPTGLVARSTYGELVIPWDTITSAAVQRTWSGKRLRLRLVPESDPRHADIVVAWLKPEMMRLVERHGVRYSLRVLDIGVDELREAFVVRSGGRIRVG